MKLGSSVITILIISIIVLSSTSYLPQNETTSTVWISTAPSSLSESINIVIDSDADFVSNGWSGSGTDLDPFVLANQTIGHIGDYGYLLIQNTDSYFEIRNCNLLLVDITFLSISNGMIEDCTALNSTITIHDSLDCSLIDNEFSFDEGYESVWMVDVSGCEIRGNEFNNGFTGITIYESSDTIISDNTFIGCIRGGVSGDYANITLTNNIFEGTGLRMDFFDQRIGDTPPIIQNNTVNGKDLGIFFNLVGAEIEAEQYGQIILGNCTETTVTEGTFTNCSTGVQIISCVNSTVIGATVTDCSWQGFTVERSNQTRIIDCYVSNCREEGIFLSVSPFYTIDNCTLEENLEGILPHIYSNNGTIINCTIRRNRPKTDTSYFTFAAGINLSNNSTAIGNTITENNVGIFVYGANCLVKDNIITHNGYGIYIGEAYSGYGERSYSNRIYGNEIGWNDRGNAYDRSWRFNMWDDNVSIGNAWSDYYGIGYYQIARDAIDHFPRFLPEGGTPLFFIHLGVGIPVSIIMVVLVVILLKRRVKTRV